MAAVMVVMMLAFAVGAGHMGFMPAHRSDSHVTHSHRSDGPQPETDASRRDAQGDQESQ